jgi:hypothetical protein
LPPREQRMSALGQKRTFVPYQLNVRFTPQSGHSFEGSPMAASDPKRTFVVSVNQVPSVPRTPVPRRRSVAADAENTAQAPHRYEREEETEPQLGRSGKDQLK